MLIQFSRYAKWLLVGFGLQILLLRPAPAQDLPEFPEGRVSGRFIYHPKSKALLLIDGYQLNPDSPVNNVWQWNGKNWKQILANGPGPKSLSSGGLNTRTGLVIMFGGVGKQNYDNLKGDTWDFDGSGWRKIYTNDIGTRDHHQMVFAHHLNAYVLYGGENGKREFDSATWIFRDGRFTRLNIPGPGARIHFGMCYDPARKKIVLYGGFSNGQIRDDLWEFNGKEWTKVKQEKMIGPRAWHQMVYDPDLKMIILHGGASFRSGDQWEFSPVTWGWNGKTWRKMAEGGPGSFLPALGYDPLRKVIVAFGGAGEDNTMNSALWELNGNKWKKITGGQIWKWVNDKYQKIEN